MSESKIEKDAVREVWHCLGILGSKLTIKGENGYPDRIFWLPSGVPFFVEFKVPGESLRPDQKKVHEFLKSNGYDVEVHTNAADCLEAVTRRLDTQRLSKEGREILGGAMRRCAVLRSRAR